MLCDQLHMNDDPSVRRIVQMADDNRRVQWHHFYSQNSIPEGFRVYVCRGMPWQEPCIAGYNLWPSVKREFGQFSHWETVSLHFGYLHFFVSDCPHGEPKISENIAGPSDARFFAQLHPPTDERHLPFGNRVSVGLLDDIMCEQIDPEMRPMFRRHNVVV